jgi:hypothetical protein
MPKAAPPRGSSERSEAIFGATFASAAKQLKSRSGKKKLNLKEDQVKLTNVNY